MHNADHRNVLKVCITGPLGCGKTLLIEQLYARLQTGSRPYKIAIAVVENPMHALWQDITPGFSVADEGQGLRVSQDLLRLRQLFNLPNEYSQQFSQLSTALEMARLPDLDLLLIEYKGNDIAAAFDPALVDMTLSVLDLSTGYDAILRGGSHITQSNLLILNKVDYLSSNQPLQEMISAEVSRQRGMQPFVFSHLLDKDENIALETISAQLEYQLMLPIEQRSRASKGGALVEEQWFWRYKMERGAHSHFANSGVVRKKPISSAPMSSAPMRYDEEGEIAWDQMWTDFCDLAALGGPPHRTSLLEPVNPTTVLADLQAYENVLGELERGLQMVTALPVKRSELTGWIGLVCEHEKMAIWLQQAILAENVCVRREKQTLYLPAGPHFRIKEEIKNVITAVAKTHHYWQEHLRYFRSVSEVVSVGVSE